MKNIPLKILLFFLPERRIFFSRPVYIGVPDSITARFEVQVRFKATYKEYKGIKYNYKEVQL